MAAAQAEAQWEFADTLVPGCRVCPALAAVGASGSECPFGRCARARELLGLLTELQEQASRLRNIRVKKEFCFPWDRPKRADRMHIEDSLPSVQQNAVT